MRSIVLKTFGGLSFQYYIRHFLFGLIFPVIFIFMSHDRNIHINLSIVILFFINTFLYPYSRFVYESIVDFLIGKNVFIVNIFLAIFFKVITMAFCWAWGILIAPFGLAYLFYQMKFVNR